MKIYSIGGNGLIGSRIGELLKDKYSFTTVSSSTGVDITNPQSLESLKNDADHEVVMLFAAKTEVDGCEQDKSLGEESEAWKINVLGVRNVVEACKANNKRLIYISTDFVFDGENTPIDGYTEESVPNPINWYGQTKYEGEKIVQKSGLPLLILRVAYPYRGVFEAKKDFVRGILGVLQQGKEIRGITDHIFCPTFVDDIASAVDMLISTNSTGVYNVVGGQALTPFDASIQIAKTFGISESLISKTTREEYFFQKAPRPFNLALNNGKIHRLGVQMKTFEKGLIEIKSQMENLKSTT